MNRVFNSVTRAVTLVAVTVFIGSGVKAQVRVDLSPNFTADVIFNNVDVTQDLAGYFDTFGLQNLPGAGAALNFTYAFGLPINRTLTSTADMGDYLLLPYTGLNAFQFHGNTAPVVLDVPDGMYDKIGILAATANGGATVNIVVNYSDATSDALTFPSPDWFNHGSGTAEIITGVDRARRGTSSWVIELSANPAIFESFIAPDPAKVVVSLTIGGGTFSEVPRTEACLFAVNGKNGATVTQFSIAGIVTKDVVFAGGDDLTADPAGYFDNPNSYNYIVNNARFPVVTPTVGLPVDRKVFSTADMGNYMLGDYSGLNTIQMNSGDFYVLDVDNAVYDKIGFLASCANGSAALDVTVTYTDASADVFTGALRAVDWFNHGTGVPEPTNARGMDRVRWNGSRWNAEMNRSPSLFESFVTPDPAKTVDTVQIGDGVYGDPFRTQASVFAMNLKSGATLSQYDLGPTFNLDVIYNGLDRTADSAGFFDNPNSYNFTVHGAIFAANTLPGNGRLNSRALGLGYYQLGNYSDVNTVQFGSGYSGPEVIDIPDGYYKNIGMLTSSSNGGNLISVFVDYDDATQDSLSVDAPDWFNHSSGIPEVITGLDRAVLTRGQWRLDRVGNPGIFEPLATPQRGKVMTQLQLSTAGIVGESKAHVFGVNLQPSADTNNDGCVDDADLTNIILDFGAAPSGNNGDTDVDGTGEVDDADLTIAILMFGYGCE